MGNAPLAPREDVGRAPPPGRARALGGLSASGVTSTGATVPGGTDIYLQADIDRDQAMTLQATSREGNSESVIGPVAMKPTPTQWFDVLISLDRSSVDAPKIRLTLDGIDLGQRDARFDVVKAVTPPVLEVHAGIDFALNNPPSGTTVLIDDLSVDLCMD